MEAKDKARELTFNYLRVGVKDIDSGLITMKFAKSCALIAVDEILKYQPYDVYTIDQGNNVNKYWGDVKLEIKKL